MKGALPDGFIRSDGKDSVGHRRCSRRSDGGSTAPTRSEPSAQCNRSPDAARRADESYDVRGMVGHGSHPEVLERAGALGADMLIAVTSSDEVNMVACQVA